MILKSTKVKRLLHVGISVSVNHYNGLVAGVTTLIKTSL
jgi:hypothetical protein